MKKRMALALVMILALSFAACGGSGTTGWESTFAKVSGIPFLATPSECEAEYDKNSPRTVTFTAKSDITDDMFTSYAQEVFDLCKAASPDGIYTINYDGVKKGDEVAGLSDVYFGEILMTYWYYTANGYITQISLKAEGSALTVKINDVYNQQGALAKP